MNEENETVESDEKLEEQSKSMTPKKMMKLFAKSAKMLTTATTLSDIIQALHLMKHAHQAHQRRPLDDHVQAVMRMLHHFLAGSLQRPDAAPKLQEYTSETEGLVVLSAWSSSRLRAPSGHAVG